MSNINSGNKSLSEVDLWIINRLLQHEQPVTLLSLIRDYAQERGLELQNAKSIIYRRIKQLEQKGLIIRNNTKPVSISLSPVFDLKKEEIVVEQLVTPKSDVEIRELRKSGLRIISDANEYRFRALEIANQKTLIQPYTKEHQEISKLFHENIEVMKSSVLLFKNKTGKYVMSPHPSRFVNKSTIYRSYRKANQILDIGFSRHKDAVFVTLTLPRTFDLVYKLDRYFVLVQDSLLMMLKRRLARWVRHHWKRLKVEVYTALEYHEDYALHLHLIIFGIPYIIDWSRKIGKKKEDALTYYSRKFNVDIPPGATKTEISKYVFTALIDKVLTDLLYKVDSLLGTDYLARYLQYKKENNLQGPINDIRRIRDRKWLDEPPPDAFLTSKLLSPQKYVVKYLTKIMRSVLSGNFDFKPEHEAKTSGYWLFSKRFYTYSPSLSPPKVEPEIEEPEEEEQWEFVGIFDENVAQEIISVHEQEDGDVMIS
jgi:hypothetical protein